jgi:hypothetical protein
MGFWEKLFSQGTEDMTAFIANTGEGYALKDDTCQTIATYSRRRDAVRGATRRGLTVVDG